MIKLLLRYQGMIFLIFGSPGSGVRRGVVEHVSLVSTASNGAISPQLHTNKAQARLPS